MYNTQKNEVKNIIELYHNKTLFCKLSQYPNQPILNSRIIYSSMIFFCSGRTLFNTDLSTKIHKQKKTNIIVYFFQKAAEW